MRLDLLGIEPVAIALERIDVEGDLRFSGLDLDSGVQVVVTIERSDKSATLAGGTKDLSDLMLVLTLGRAGEPA